jgi:FlaG/FlaF family flagellin (archaellin)
VSSTSNINYAFTWNVKDPTGIVHQATNSTNAPHAASFVESVAYPGKFGSGPSLAYTGIYAVWVNQTQPPLVGSTGVGTPVQFQVGLTDSLSYQRLLPLSIKAVNYAASGNVTIKISGANGMVPGFPLNKTADSTGSLSYTWPIPISLPVGDYTLTLTGSPVKNPVDIQLFTVTATNVTISSLIISRTLLQTSQTEDFRFSASYPNSALVKTGSVNLRLVEVDGTTSHSVAMTYSSTLNAFHGSYQIPLSGQVGPWIATIEVNSFDDGYGNKGPVSSVLKAFTVSPATLTVSAITNYNNYTIGGIVVIYASVVTPGGYNFTSGAVTATTYHASNRIGSPLPLFYDQSRGKWVGSYTVNSTNPAGIWQIQVNASDTYGNMGQGSTSSLVTVPAAPPQQSSTFTYLLIVVIALLGGLGILASWIVFGRRRVLRRVLKVDLEAIHAEAKKVENQDFFKKVQEQLKLQKMESSEGKDKAVNG